METRKKSAILDHWGKGAPSKEEIAALEESLRREMQAFEREEEKEKGLPSPPQQEAGEEGETGTKFNGGKNDVRDHVQMKSAKRGVQELPNFVDEQY